MAVSQAWVQPHAFPYISVTVKKFLEVSGPVVSRTREDSAPPARAAWDSRKGTDAKGLA